jgi:hypothetical protein
MKITTTRNEILTLKGSLELALKSIKNAPFKLSYAISKNINLLESEEKIIMNILHGKQEFKEYNEKRIKLVEKLCEKDKSGKPIIDFDPKNPFMKPRYRLTPEQEKQLEEEIKPIKDEYKEVIEDYEATVKTLDDPIEIELHTISETLLTDLKLDGEVVHTISKFITDKPDLKVV